MLKLFFSRDSICFILPQNCLFDSNTLNFATRNQYRVTVLRGAFQFFTVHLYNRICSLRHLPKTHRHAQNFFAVSIQQTIFL